MSLCTDSYSSFCIVVCQCTFVGHMSCPQYFSPINRLLNAKGVIFTIFKIKNMIGINLFGWILAKN